MICRTYEQFFRTLADPTKLCIISSLREGAKSVSDICACANFEQSRASHNLRALRELGFVNCRRVGKQMIYSLDETTVIPLLKMIDKHVDAYYRHYCRCVGKAKKKRWAKRR